MRWFGAILAIGPYEQYQYKATSSRTTFSFLIRTVLLANLAVVPRRLATDNSSGMPQPRESRRFGSSEMPQAQVLSYAADSEERHSDECDGVQAP
jgi:hypothetical protein